MYDNRLWLRRMSREQAEEVITGPCEQAGVSTAPALVRSLLDALNSSGNGVDLPTLQVVLDSLYRQAVATSDSAPVLSFEDYQALGQVHSILARFLDERIAALGERAETAKQVLKTLVTAEATRRPATQEEIARRLTRDFRVKLPEVELSDLLETLVQGRVLREDPDRHCYELRHDSLAPHVRSWMNVLEQELEALRESLDNRLREYRRNRRLLEAPFLADLAPYEGRLVLDGELAKFVQSSKDELQREQTRQREQESARQKQRQRVIAGVGGAFLLVLADFGGFSYMQWQRAEVNYSKAGQAVDEFFTQVSESTLLNKPAMEPLRKELLEKALKYYQELLAQRAESQVMQIALINAYQRVASIKQDLGDISGALQAYVSAKDAIEALVNRHPSVLRYQKALADRYSELAKVQILNNDVPGATESHKKAFEIMNRLAAEDPDNLGYQVGLAWTLEHVAKMQFIPDQENAIKTGARAIDVIEKALERHPGKERLRGVLASFHNNLGSWKERSGDSAGAMDSYRMAAEIFEQLTVDSPRKVTYQNNLAATYSYLSRLQSNNGNLKGALESSKKQLAIADHLLLAYPNLPDQQENDAIAQNNVGQDELAIGNIGAALISYRKAVEIAQKLANEHPDLPKYQSLLAVCTANIAEAQRRNGDVEAARESYKKALAIRERLVKEHPDTPDYQSDLASTYVDLGKLDETSGDPAGARESFTRAAEVWERLAREHIDEPAYAKNRAIADGGLAWVELLDRKPTAAIAAATHALELDPKQTRIKAKLAHGLLFDGQYAKALAIYTESKDATLDGGQTFAETVVDDFKQLRAKGLEHPDMPKIEELMRGAVPAKP